MESEDVRLNRAPVYKLLTHVAHMENIPVGDLRE